MEALPSWEAGTPGVLCVSGPRAIPVSTAVRVGARRLLFALARRRDALARVRADPAVALCILGAGAAFTAEGHAHVARESLAGAPGVCALELRVDRLHDHLAGGPTEMLDGARWRFASDDAARADAAVRAALDELAAELGRDL